MVVDAVVRNFEIIGEAASQISKEFVYVHADVPFRKMIRLRNSFIHGYFGVNLHILWNEILNDVPAWKKKLENDLQ